MTRKTARPPIRITLTLPDSESVEQQPTLLVQRGDLARLHPFTYTRIADLSEIIADALIAFEAVEASPPVLPEISQPAPAGKRLSAPPVPSSAEPTVDIPLRKGKKAVRISHLKLTGGETDAAAYRQAVQIASVLIDGKLWDGETPIRMPDVYALARKMKYLTPADMALFTLEDFVQVGESTNTDPSPSDADSYRSEAPTSPGVSANGHHANGNSDFSALL